jgi:OFA family oxalate/formate antiporter-like MFS transporter
MGFGAGSAATLVPIAAMIDSRGYEQTFLLFGLIQGLSVFLLGWGLRTPPSDRDEPINHKIVPPHPGPQCTPWEMLRSPIFWVMYAMFVMMAAGGLMATAQLGPISRDFNIADTPVTLIGLTLPALPFALSIDRALNGVTRPFFGWVSDRIGRENTMGVAFALEGAGIVALSLLGRDPTWFVLLTGVVFFAWGEIYSLFPATCCDIFGARYAASNAGLLYTAKGTAALLVPLTSIMAARGGWNGVFAAAAILNFAAAAMAMIVLKPLRRRRKKAIARDNQERETA